MTILNTAGLVEESLRTLGTLSPLDDGADPAEFAIALKRLNMVVNYLCATEKPWWFVPVRQEFSLKKDQSGYIMQGLLNSRLQYVREAYLVKSGSRTPLELYTRSRYLDRVGNPATGEPKGLYIPREESPTLEMVPTPHIDGYSVELSGYGYSDDLTEENGANPHGFPEAWELAVAYRTARDLGSGAITRLPKNERDDLKADADEMLRALRAYNDRQNIAGGQVTQYRDF
jgi:hypothetical protein